MGWSGANVTISRIAQVAENHGGDDDAYCMAYNMLAELVKACRDHDADDLYELEGQFPLLDEVLRAEGVLK